jgi:hypothetical protein
MPRQHQVMAQLFSLLAKSIGTESAKQELKWMKQASHNGLDTCLEVMLQRRVRGEPLQYILGECIVTAACIGIKQAQMNLRNSAIRAARSACKSACSHTPPRDRKLGH